MARVLNILGYGLIVLGAAVIVVGSVSVLVFQGWGAFADLFSPFNGWNVLALAVILAPGILLVTLAEKMEKRKK